MIFQGMKFTKYSLRRVTKQNYITRPLWSLVQTLCYTLPRQLLFHVTEQYTFSSQLLKANQLRQNTKLNYLPLRQHNFHWNLKKT